MNKEDLVKEFKPKGLILTKEEKELLASFGLKWCRKCESVKEFSEFGKDKHKSDGFTAKCLECNKEYCKKYHSNNTKKVSFRKKQYREDNPELIKNIKKKCYLKHRKENVNYSIQWNKKKYKEDDNFKIKCICRKIVHRTLKLIGTPKEEKTNTFLGYSAKDLKQHIEKQFKEGMTWDNYGTWHIDHIVPISLAENIEQAKVLSQLSNLQPLWAEENLRKGNK